MVILMLVIYFGFLIRNFELNYINEFLKISWSYEYFFNSCWLEIVTITTVGYGDGYPRSPYGRFIGVISCILG